MFSLILTFSHCDAVRKSVRLSRIGLISPHSFTCLFSEHLLYFRSVHVLTKTDTVSFLWNVEPSVGGICFFKKGKNMYQVVIRIKRKKLK